MLWVVHASRAQPRNTPPSLSSLPDLVAIRADDTLTVPFFAWDAESGAKMTLTAWSSREGVVRNSDLHLSSSSRSNRVLQIVLRAKSAPGSTAITIEANDGEDANRVSFILNVVEPEFARVGQAISAGANFEPVLGDFNGDGLLDLVASPTQILTNNGSGVFLGRIPLPGGFGLGSAAPADFDGDGHLDLLLLVRPTRLLRNDGGSPPAFIELPLPVENVGPAAFWVDLDGDGDLDIVPALLDPRIGWLRNDGRNGFVVASLGLPLDVSGTVLAVGDFDGDGDTDILIGQHGSPFLRLFENDGSTHFQESLVALPQAITSAAGWVDVDGDGVPDLWLLQALQLNNRTNTLTVLRQSAGRFTETFRLNFPAASLAAPVTNVVWADFDNDGYVDFVAPYRVATSNPATMSYAVVYHNDGTGRFTTKGLPAFAERRQVLPVVGDFTDDGAADLIYQDGALSPLRNQTHVLNSLPDAPSGLHAFVAGDLVALFWNAAEDATQRSALTYNIRVGTTPDDNQVVPSMSTTNGTRMVVQPGNAGFNTWTVLRLPLDQLNVETLFWSVQAVDASFQGGPFAAEGTFAINPPGNQPPSIVGLRDLSFPENTGGGFDFFVRDDRTRPRDLRVNVATSNPALIADSGVHLSAFVPTDQGLRVDLSLTPVPNQFGEVLITVTATDGGGLSTSRFLVVTVTKVDSPPVITIAGAQVAPVPGESKVELRSALGPGWRLEASTDLTNWVDVLTLGSAMDTDTNGITVFHFPPLEPRQFFRARSEGN